MRRTIRKIFKWLLITLGIFLIPVIFIMLFVRIDPENTSKFYSEFPRDQFFEISKQDFYVDSLQKSFGGLKNFEDYDAAALIALSRYPELRDIEISFEISDSGAPMESSFDLSTILNDPDKRKYIIYLLESEGSMFDPILMANLPFNAQIGILAHELGHTAYYHRLNFWQIAKWGIMYTINPGFRSKHERSTDLLPVYRGLGVQIYDYAEYVRTSPETIDLYEKGKWFIDTFYLTHDEIRAEMDKLGY